MMTYPLVRPGLVCTDTSRHPEPPKVAVDAHYWSLLRAAFNCGMPPPPVPWAMHPRVRRLRMWHEAHPRADRDTSSPGRVGNPAERQARPEVRLIGAPSP